MIFYQMRGRETTFQSPMVRVVLSRITLLKSVFFCRSFLYRKKKRRRKECVTHEIRITGIAWCKKKRGNLKIPSFHIFSSIGCRQRAGSGASPLSLPPEGGVTPPPSSGSGASPSPGVIVPLPPEGFEGAVIPLRRL